MKQDYTGLAARAKSASDIAINSTGSVYADSNHRNASRSHKIAAVNAPTQERREHHYTMATYHTVRAALHAVCA